LGLGLGWVGCFWEWKASVRVVRAFVVEKILWQRRAERGEGHDRRGRRWTRGAVDGWDGTGLVPWTKVDYGEAGAGVTVSEAEMIRAPSCVKVTAILFLIKSIYQF
jgi:hypothetical protein